RPARLAVLRLRARRPLRRPRVAGRQHPPRRRPRRVGALEAVTSRRRGDLLRRVTFCDAVTLCDAVALCDAVLLRRRAAPGRARRGPGVTPWPARSAPCCPRGRGTRSRAGPTAARWAPAAPRRRAPSAPTRTSRRGRRC